MDLSKKTKKAGVIAGTTITIAVILGISILVLLNSSAAVTIYLKEHLFADATYLLKTDETNETVNVTCEIYLTNIWEKESGNIKATAYVIETNNNLAVYKNSVEIGEITADSTAEVNIPIVLSNNSYKVDILIFEKDKLVLKGKITISAYPLYDWEEILHGAKQRWELKNTVYEFDQIH